MARAAAFQTETNDEQGCRRQDDAHTVRRSFCGESHSSAMIKPAQWQA